MARPDPPRTIEANPRAAGLIGTVRTFSPMPHSRGSPTRRAHTHVLDVQADHLGDAGAGIERHQLIARSHPYLTSHRLARCSSSLLVFEADPVEDPCEHAVDKCVEGPLSHHAPGRGLVVVVGLSP